MFKSVDSSVSITNSSFSITTLNYNFFGISETVTDMNLKKTTFTLEIKGNDLKFFGLAETMNNVPVIENVVISASLENSQYD